ncbi:MAG: restriction endonuclease subunit S [Syntrophaceae bacterium]|nr:restriction endonuclease subunit S [Syntrophaceae bacterium]
MGGEAFEELTLDDIADFRNGKAISPEKYSPEGRYPVFGANGQIARSNAILNPEPVIAIGRVGAYCGSVYYISEPSWVTDNAIVAIPKKPNDLRFLHYLLGSLDLRRTAIGSAQPLMTQGGLKVVQTIVPPIKEQQAIACILGALDDKIELNRRINRTLEAMARAIFKSWFVDFDPVRAKVACGQLPGLAPHIADLFPATFEDSELGEIPKGWKLKTVAEIALINTRTLGKNDAIEVVDYIEISKVMRGQVSEITRYERGAEPSRARRRLGHGDTALSTVRPDRGAYFLCLNPPDTLIASTGFAVASPKNGSWAFLHVALTRPDVGQELGRLADGGAYPAVRPEVIGGLPVVTPSNDQLINAYENVAQPLFKKADRNRAENTSLSAIRDNLLPKLISGELRVPDAESVVERCV